MKTIKLTRLERQSLDDARSKARSKGQAILAIGGLSAPSKMPCKSYGLPASRCLTGSKLRNVEGSTCSDCYACKGCYLFSSTVGAHARRMAIVDACVDSGDWRNFVDSFVILLRDKPHFRWHDSGDIQSVSHLDAIVQIAWICNTTQFWIPTREFGMVRAWMRENGEFPPNLNVRVSAHMTGTIAVSIPGTTSSAVDIVSTMARPDDTLVNTFHCPAPGNNGECGDCRACWNREVPVVTYILH